MSSSEGQTAGLSRRVLGGWVRLVCIALSLGVAGVGASAARAQGAFPVKPVRLVVAFPAGGPTDFVARLIAPKLSEALGQQFLVENRVGAGGNIGTVFVAKAPADGYTLLVAGSSFPVNQSLFSSAGYDAVKDFTPISNLAVTPMVVVANPSVSARTMAELAALGRNKNARTTFATPGLGTLPHLLIEMMNKAEGAAIELVHYKGGAQSTMSVIGGETALSMGAISSYMAHVKAGKVVPIAVTSPRRLAALPDVPTMSEAGMPALESEPVVGGVLGPNGLAADIVTTLHRELAKAVRSPEVGERMRASGIDVLGNSPEQFAVQIKADVERWAKVVREAGIKPN